MVFPEKEQDTRKKRLEDNPNSHRRSNPNNVTVKILSKQGRHCHTRGPPTKSQPMKSPPTRSPQNMLNSKEDNDKEDYPTSQHTETMPSSKKKARVNQFSDATPHSSIM
jgi:hypothetical protein